MHRHVPSLRSEEATSRGRQSSAHLLWGIGVGGRDEGTPNICAVEHDCLDGRSNFAAIRGQRVWGTGPPVECDDGVDNDGDTRTDFGDDPGCNSPEDDDETDGCDINGTTEADVLVGTSAGEVICGMGGDDTITGDRR